MRIQGLAACLVLSQALAAPPARAGGGVWTTGGPAPVRPVLVDPASPLLVFAGGTDRVFRSEDGGQTWIDSVTEIGSEIRTLAIDPTRREILYAGTSPQCPGNFGSVVFKSFDGGSHWFETQPGVRCLSARVVVLDPLQPQTLFAGMGPTLRNTSVGVYRSDDGGLNWVRVGSPPCPFVLDLSVESDRFLAATGGCGLWESVDRGATWAPVNGGLPPGAAQAVQAVARLPLGPLDWVIGTLMGIYRTSDGTNWTATEVRASTTDLAADPAHPGRLFAATFDQGVLRSDDGGAHWAAFNEGLAVREVRSLALGPFWKVLVRRDSGRRLSVRVLLVRPGARSQLPRAPVRPVPSLARRGGSQDSSHGGGLRLEAVRRVRMVQPAPLHRKPGESRGLRQDPRRTARRRPLLGFSLRPHRSRLCPFRHRHRDRQDAEYRKESGTACGGFDTSHFRSLP